LENLTRQCLAGSSGPSCGTLRRSRRGSAGGSSRIGATSGRVRAASSSPGAGGDEECPLAIEVVDREGEFVLLGFELELTNAGADDEGVGLGAKATDLTLSDI